LTWRPLWGRKFPARRTRSCSEATEFEAIRDVAQFARIRGIAEFVKDFLTSGGSRGTASGVLPARAVLFHLSESSRQAAAPHAISVAVRRPESPPPRLLQFAHAICPSSYRPALRVARMRCAGASPKGKQPLKWIILVDFHNIREDSWGRPRSGARRCPHAPGVR